MTTNNKPPGDTIVLQAPVGTKGNWVRRSRDAGRKLSDWVVDAVERGAAPESPCPRCGSTALTVDGPDWLCSGCRLVR